MEEQSGPLRRQQRAMSELLKIAKENNRILRGERNLRRLKVLIVALFLIGSTGYGYHLFGKYQAEFVKVLGQVEDLRNQVNEVVEIGGQIKETTQSITDVLGGGGEEGGEGE